MFYRDDKRFKSFPCDFKLSSLYLQSWHICSQSPCRPATCSSVSLYLYSLVLKVSSHFVFLCRSIMFCVLTIYVFLIFMCNEVRLRGKMRPRPLTSLFAQCWVTIRHNQSLISQTNTITRSVSQFGFEMNCGNELWQDWWSVQTGMTQHYTHFPPATAQPHHLALWYELLEGVKRALTVRQLRARTHTHTYKATLTQI